MTQTRKTWIVSAAVAVTMLGGGCQSGSKTHAQAKAAAKERWGNARGGVLYGLALQQFQNGELDKAEQTCVQAMEAAPKNVPCQELIARIMIERGELERAYVMLEQVQKLDPARPEPHYLTGIVLQRWQRYDGALAAFDEAYRLKPDQPSAFLAAAEMLVKLDRVDEALTRLEDKKAYFENNADLRVELGRVHMLRRDFPHAVACFHEASVLDPEDDGIKEHLALAQVAAAQHAEAIQNLKALIQTPKGKDRDDLRMALGDCYLATQRPVEARAQFLEIVRRNEGDVDAWIKLGQAAWIVEDPVRLSQAAERVTVLAPERHEGYLLRGMIEQRAGRYEAAVAQFELAAQKAPASAAPLLLKGVAMEKMGDRAGAAEAYRQALKVAPDDPRAMKMLAAVSAG